MKQSIQRSSLILLGLTLILSLTACDATNAEEYCLSFGSMIGAEDVKWDQTAQSCLLKEPESTCYPEYDILQYTGSGSDYLNPASWIPNGCTEPVVPEPIVPEPVTEVKPRIVIKDPLLGGSTLGDGSSFKYEAQTCDGACKIRKYGLTPPAIAQLDSAPGKVIGKTYIQIFDKSGDLNSGDFSLCLPAKGSKNPAYYRLGGGSSWVYIGGYWRGSQFCMSGTQSGNYILVD